MNLGVEGFAAAGSAVFVKGEYVAKLTGYDNSEATGTVISLMAHTLDSLIPGRTANPWASPRRTAFLLLREVFFTNFFFI